jgi:hypothetical protein
MARILPYVVLSTAAAGSVVYYTLNQHKQFYPAMVALYNSNLSMMVRLGNVCYD